MSQENLIKTNTEYGVDQIGNLEGLEAVRKRPGMYIGSTSQKGVSHLVFEAADNSVDEFMQGFGTGFKLDILKDCTVVVQDCARGIPVGPHPTIKENDGTPMNALTAAVMKLHTGGKFGNGGYKCFKKGSKVNTSNGLVPIENIEQNMKIKNAYNESDEVLNKFEYDYNGDINKIELENGKIIEAIDGHYILIQRGKQLYWISIENILDTDMLIELDETDNIEELKNIIPKYTIKKY